MSSAGWGALAGLGQGMMHYSTLLGQKREEDWKAEAERVKDERYANLLRQQSVWQGEREASGRKDAYQNQVSLLEATNKSNLSQQEALLRQQARLSQDPEIAAAQEAADARSLKTKEGELALEQKYEFTKLQRIIDLNANASEQARVKSLQTLNNDEWYKSQPKSVQEKMVFATMHPEAAKVLAGMEASGKVSDDLVEQTMENYQRFFDKGIEDFGQLDERQQGFYKKQGAEQNPPVSGSSFYASTLAQRETGIMDQISGQAAVDNSKVYKAIVADLSSGDLSTEDAERRFGANVTTKAAKEAGVPYTPTVPAPPPEDVPDPVAAPWKPRLNKEGKVINQPKKSDTEAWKQYLEYTKQMQSGMINQGGKPKPLSIRSPFGDVDLK
jgi:hypothetical protein